MTNVLPYHIGPEDRYSLEFVNPDEGEWKGHLAARTTERGVAFKSREVTIETDEGIQSLYAVYSDAVPETVLDDQSDEEIQAMLDEQFTEAEIQVLSLILDVFIGITKKEEEQTGRFTIYKDMNLLKIPEILAYPKWGEASITDVGGQLLSRFILSHPMPNANHRSALGLLERYLRSHGDGLTVPDTGEPGIWYQWARPYIHDSKRLLTVCRNAHLFRYAREFGVDIILRKNDVDIDLHDFDLDVVDPLESFGQTHEDRSVDFVETILDQADADTKRFETTQDPGFDAFVDALTSD